jgi:hypothetical protein
VPLYFVCFYALERIKHDSKWWAAAGLSMATVFTSSPTHSAYFGFFLVFYFVTKMIVDKKILWRHAMAGLLGVLLSSIFWWIPMLAKHGFKGTLEGMGFSIGILTKFGAAAAFRGTGDRTYTFSDFFFAQKDQPQ